MALIALICTRNNTLLTDELSNAFFNLNPHGASFCHFSWERGHNKVASITYLIFISMDGDNVLLEGGKHCTLI